jgi:hypothetical protein
VVPVTVKVYHLLVYDKDADYFIFRPKAGEINDQHPRDLGRILLYPRNKRLAAAEAMEQFEAAEIIGCIDGPTGELATKRLISEYPESAQIRQVGLVSEHLILRDRFLHKFLRDVGFTPPSSVAKTWHSYPDYRKLLIAADMAQSADTVHGADRLLGMMFCIGAAGRSCDQGQYDQGQCPDGFPG